MADNVVKDYKFQKSDRDLDNRNNKQLKEIIIQIQADLNSIKSRLSKLESQ